MSLMFHESSSVAENPSIVVVDIAWSFDCIIPLGHKGEDEQDCLT